MTMLVRAWSDGPNFVRLDSTRLDSRELVGSFCVFGYFLGLYVLLEAMVLGASPPPWRGVGSSPSEISLSPLAFASYIGRIHASLSGCFPDCGPLLIRVLFCRLTLDPRSWDMLITRSKPSFIIAGACAYSASLVLLLGRGLCLGNPKIARFLNHIKCLEPIRRLHGSRGSGGSSWSQFRQRGSLH